MKNKRSKFLGGLLLLMFFFTMVYNPVNVQAAANDPNFEIVYFKNADQTEPITNTVNKDDIFYAWIRINNPDAAVVKFNVIGVGLYFDPTVVRVVNSSGVALAGTPENYVAAAQGRVRRADFYNADEGTGTWAETAPATIDSQTGLFYYALNVDPSVGGQFDLPGGLFDVVGLRFKAIAAGDPKIQFAVRDVAPSYVPSFPQGYSIEADPPTALNAPVVGTLMVADPAAVEAALAAVNGATLETIATVLSDHNDTLGLDLTGDYAALSDKVPVHTALVGKNFTTIEEVITAFDAAVASQKAIEAALTAVNGATAETIAAVLTAHNDTLGLDLTGDYASLNDKSPVHQALVGKNFTTVNEIRTAFNTAVAEQKSIEDAITAATTAVEEAEALVAQPLDTQAKIDAAQAKHNAAEALVTALSDGAVKTDLTNRLATVQTAINDAQAVLAAVQAATAAVEEAEALVAQPMDTQAKIDAAQAKHDAAETLVIALPDGAAKTALTARLATVQTAINEAQTALAAVQAATAAVEEAEGLVAAGLDTQAKIDAAQAKHDAAETLVTALPDGATKTALTERLAIVQTDITNAQAELWMQTFVITTTGGDLGINKTPGISAKVKVSPASTGMNAVVIFQLMQGNTPISLVAIEKNIDADEIFTAQFPGFTGDAYSVKVFVWDKLDNSTDSVGTNYAYPATLE